MWQRFELQSQHFCRRNLTVDYMNNRALVIAMENLKNDAFQFMKSSRLSERLTHHLNELLPPSEFRYNLTQLYVMLIGPLSFFIL